jgi:glycosyltransferase involved in cell wall biosynthesis
MFRGAVANKTTITSITPMPAENNANASLPIGKPAKVSIGMPVYNAEKSIRRALDSILNQTFTDFELIISDNASTDATEAICREYAKTDDRISYLRQPKNCGAPTNFNRVLHKACGEYFMWAACDDFRSRDCLEFYLKQIEDSNAFFSTYNSFDTENSQYSKHHNPPVLSGKPNEKCEDLLKYSKHMCAHMIYGLFRRECLKEMKLRTYDWADCYLIADYIKLHGYKTQLSEPKFTFGVSGKYIIKTSHPLFLNPLFFLRDLFFTLVSACGIGGFFAFAKVTMVTARTALTFNAAKVCSYMLAKVG